MLCRGASREDEGGSRQSRSGASLCVICLHGARETHRVVHLAQRAHRIGGRALAKESKRIDGFSVPGKEEKLAGSLVKWNTEQNTEQKEAA